DVLNDPEIKEQLSSLKLSSNNYSGIVDILHASVMKSVEKRLTAIEQRLTAIEQNQENMAFEMNKRERHSRQFNLRFVGIDEQEHSSQAIVALAQKVGLTEITENDIEISHRLGPGKPGYNRVVIARFHSRVKRRSLLIKRKEVKQSSAVVIYEDLTKVDKHLLDELRYRLAEDDRKYAFTRNGRVMYKYEDKKVGFIDSYDNIDYFLQ
ncbi:unnamed protein product, partial [Didymodactylos carnosus]